MDEILSILEKINKETGSDRVDVFLDKNFYQIGPCLEFRLQWGDFHFRHVFSNAEIKSVKDDEILVNYLIRKANNKLENLKREGK